MRAYRNTSSARAAVNCERAISILAPPLALALRRAFSRSQRYRGIVVRDIVQRNTISELWDVFPLINKSVWFRFRPRMPELLSQFQIMRKHLGTATGSSSALYQSSHLHTSTVHSQYPQFVRSASFRRPINGSAMCARSPETPYHQKADGRSRCEIQSQEWNFGYTSRMEQNLGTQQVYKVKSCEGPRLLTCDA